ncbi:uncharacterized protein MONOS_10025 [Monocercomonoides exilis]|uniref:uncharacterized protein n=1 Tax=Monocercomonoides exilis TaxID=2049356 RepID=UPI00355ACD03|nr:hypothetical protein MONOS_10025 [Monocercomonoides exilis]|eukprot:MONOS_10025.1-p1 / transcript=MONOS_10025.1 / gene=MONOS_10025 / organism=Monocercomonoides_exilis_PA203 / gene_product=unspecified product / transcript_product=unspecified product / location=Mono_scaffold00438:10066-11166(+) / protein_length=262 / sequence_SO=supercontig / SO=protein_coding / is_pseudo=false
MKCSKCENSSIFLVCRKCAPENSTNQITANDEKKIKLIQQIGQIDSLIAQKKAEGEKLEQLRNKLKDEVLDTSKLILKSKTNQDSGCEKQEISPSKDFELLRRLSFMQWMYQNNLKVLSIDTLKFPDSSEITSEESVIVQVISQTTSFTKEDWQRVESVLYFAYSFLSAISSMLKIILPCTIRPDEWSEDLSLNSLLYLRICDTIFNNYEQIYNCICSIKVTAPSRDEKAKVSDPEMEKMGYSLKELIKNKIPGLVDFYLS